MSSVHLKRFLTILIAATLGLTIALWNPLSLALSPSSLVTGSSSLVTSPSSLVTGSSSLVTGSSSLVTGSSSLVTSPSSLVTSPSSLVTSPSSLVTSPSLLDNHHSTPEDKGQRTKDKERRTKDKGQRTKDKERRTKDDGRILYEAGRYTQAIAVWQRQLREFTVRGDRRNRALTLSRLALAYGQVGEWNQANQTIAASLDLIRRSASIQDPELALAQILTIQGHLQLSQGNAETALATWQQAYTAYRSVGATAQMIQTEINRANALRAMGLYNRAYMTLETVVTQIKPQPDSSLKAAALLHLGNTLRLVRVLDKSQEALKESLAVAERIGDQDDRQLALMHLGNTARANDAPMQALDYYRQVTCPSPAPAVQEQSSAPQPSCLVKLQADLNQVRLLVELAQLDGVAPLISTLQAQLVAIPVSEWSIYAQIDFAESLARYLSLRNNPSTRPIEQPTTTSRRALENERYPISNVTPEQIREIAQLLVSAIQQAKQINNLRAESYALGHLGGLYEKTEQWSEAMDLTKQALLLAQGLNTPSTIYQWQWQLGRLLRKTNDRTQAIVAYGEAVSTLEDIRNDLTAFSADVQLSFREKVEPVYRDLIDLLLPTNTKIEQDRLKRARDLMESLQLAELENYFREACLDRRPRQVDTIDQKAAVLYSILLDDRLEVILSLPNRSTAASSGNDRLLRHYTTQQPRPEIEQTIAKMRLSLRRNSFLKERLPLAKIIYSWLIKPFEADLAGIETIVFLLDGSLRDIPMAALHGDRHYLIEDFQLALTPSFRLLKPSPLNEGGLRVLIAGVSQATQGFIPLPGVETEVAQIAATNNLSAVTLLNQEFTPARLEQQLKATPFPIIHLATHGRFSSNPNQTFILAWNEKIYLSKLEEILKIFENRPEPIELLILSACQTASGDDRASLGLAGMAVRSGARSTLATLWAVEDQSTSSLMAEFYRQVTQPGVTRSEALRRAQLSLLHGDYEHPYFWAPFVLVGNWL